MRRFIPFLLALVSVCSFVQGYEYKYTTEKIDNTHQRISVHITLQPEEYLYKDSFLPTINTPDVKLSPVKVEGQAVTFFDKGFKANKEGYKNTVSFSFDAQRDSTKEVSDALVHTHFSVSSSGQPQEKAIPLSFKQPALEQKGQAAPTAPPTVEQPHTPKHEIPCEIPQPSLLGSLTQQTINTVGATVAKWKHTLSSLFTSTGSRLIRLLVALILGILLSLTPCIYPMIPITVGILQANTSKSPVRSFLLALSYTLGISLTFAVLGLIAALGSCIFGELQGSPWTIIPLAALLFYFGGSMFGFYEMYIPRFMQPKATTQVKGGSFLSAFVFGAISGTVASPCLSPGLALILNYVVNLSTAGSVAGYLEGFILLFVFGIGSSLPLLIIGTFSSSMTMLPQAGMWMVEIKKLFGIMLMGMAFYHLSHLERYLPWYILVWIVVASLFALGIYYFASVTKFDSAWLRRYKYFMGTALIVSACLMAVNGYKATYEHVYPKEQPSIWLHDYTQALERAQKEKKRLFIDIGATYCSACKALDKRILKHDKVLKVLENLYIPLKIESDVHITSFEAIKKPYGHFIAGFPTFLIVDPATNQVIKKWDIDLDELSIEAIVQELEKYNH
jgi:thiol:disulfide interchange protein